MIHIAPTCRASGHTRFTGRGIATRALERPWHDDKTFTGMEIQKDSIPQSIVRTDRTLYFGTSRTRVYIRYGSCADCPVLLAYGEKKHPLLLEYLDCAEIATEAINTYREKVNKFRCRPQFGFRFTNKYNATCRGIGLRSRNLCCTCRLTLLSPSHGSFRGNICTLQASSKIPRHACCICTLK